jgi:cysteine desulfurase family protein (TIGR01976 family)
MFDVPTARQQFPSLGAGESKRTGKPARTPIFLDGPGGTQVPRSVVEAMVRYLTTCNANHGGVFATSQQSDAVLQQAHQALADLLNAPAPDEIIFGPNMTTLTFQVSRAFGRTLRPGEEVLVTRLDHDANISPWVLAARDAGASARFVDIHPEDGTLDLDDLQRQLHPRVRLLAVTCASNAVGTVNDVRRITQMAHAAGALVYLDAVHHAPHRLIDVREWGCDFLACSVYKFFGPHVGVLWARRDLLESLPAYKVRPATEELPDRWMTGTQNHEGMAGAAAAVDYLASLGTEAMRDRPRRERLAFAYAAIQDYEQKLADQLLDGLLARPRFRVWGITQREQRGWRVPTVSITAKDRTPQQLAEHLASREIYAWNGNMYALELTERLGLEQRGGLLRLGLVHYNTREEIDRLLQALDEL